MLFKIQSLLPILACILATGHLVKSAPHADLSSLEQSPSEDHVIAKRAITLDVWAGQKDTGSISFKKVLKSPFVTAATAKKDAKDGYKNAISKTDSKYKSDVQLVAALYISSGPGKGIYVSSIPKGPASALMRPEDAPAWAHQVAERTPRTYHAEDGAMWLFENELSTKLAAGDEYPPGSTIYVYGHFKDGNGNAKEADYQPPCSQYGPNPSCTNILNNLGITLGS